MRDSSSDWTRDLLVVVPSRPALVYGITWYLSRHEFSLSQSLGPLLMSSPALTLSFGASYSTSSIRQKRHSKWGGAQRWDMAVSSTLSISLIFCWYLRKLGLPRLHQPQITLRWTFPASSEGVLLQSKHSLLLFEHWYSSSGVLCCD